MASNEHPAILRRGAEAWNTWRRGQDLDQPNLARQDFRGLDLEGADLFKAALTQSDLSDATLRRAVLTRAHLTAAVMRRADLSYAQALDAHISQADLRQATLAHADLKRVDFSFADLAGADLRGAQLTRAFLLQANLRGADLREADLRFADLDETDLVGADLRGARLQGAALRDTRLEGANLSDCKVYGVAVWDIRTDEQTEQTNLIVTPDDQAVVTVDSLEVAQFIYLMLHNRNIRQVIDTITSKVVLILGRFTHERKLTLEGVRAHLRRRGYLPILFDFDVPSDRDVTETVTLLARMARFVVADLTDPSSIPKELEAFVPDLAVPVQPVLMEQAASYSMFKDYWKYDWVMPVVRYESTESLIDSLDAQVIAPAEAKVSDLRARRLAALS